MSNFNPNSLGIKNGNYFGLPYTEEEAKLVFLPVTWDVTTSYRPGTHNGPQAILDASMQIDLYDSDLVDAYKIGYSTLPLDIDILNNNSLNRAKAEKVIKHLEEGGDENDETIVSLLDSINESCFNMNQSVYKKSLEYINKGKIIGLVGGDHSTPLGYIQAISETYKEFGILHIDAHADLRDSYEGFKYSHASIMFNALEIKNLKSLVQVAIRDFCEDEINIAKKDKRIVQFSDSMIKENSFEGKTWSKQAKEIIKNLPDLVYISFDIDGLAPDLCPNTGTPVPGGLSFHEAVYLIKTLALSGKRIIGFDINEVAPGKNDEWDANVGARMLYKLANLTMLSNR